MNLLVRGVFALGVAGIAPMASAHFVWAVMDSGKGEMHVEFSEAPGDSIIPKFAGKSADAKGWAPKQSPLGLKVDGDALVAAARDVAGVTLSYGVLDKEAEGRGTFLLQYYAKAASTPQASKTKVGLTFELSVATLADGRVTIAAEKSGKPVGGAELSIHLPGQENPLEAKTDASGTFTIPKVKGLLAIRAGTFEAASGSVAGKSYKEIRHYTTLTVNIPDSLAKGPNPKANPEAYKVLRAATENREALPADVSGVTGKLKYELDGLAMDGDFTYRRGQKIAVNLSSTLASGEASGILQSLFGHRQGRDFDEGDGRYPLALDGANELGQRVAINDDISSFLRVKDGRITEVDRTMGDRRLVINVLENVVTPSGKTLPKVFAVSYFDPKTQALTRSEYFTDDYQVIDGVYLHVRRQIISAEAGKIRVCTLSLSDLKVQRAGQ